MTIHDSSIANNHHDNNDNYDNYDNSDNHDNDDNRNFPCPSLIPPNFVLL